MDFLKFAQAKLGFGHLSSIACVDWPKENKFSLSYNLFSYSEQILLTAKIYIGRQKAEFWSISDIYYAARFFERDIYEMFGINFVGNSYQKKFILDEWQGTPPMRKDFDTRQYANDNFSWRIYEPKWAKALGIDAEKLKGEDLELL